MRAIRSSGILVAVAAIIAAPASAQSTSRIGGGFALGATPNLAEGFSSDQICPKRSAVSASARATFALTTMLQLEALGEVFLGPGSTCVSAPLPPPPPVGPYSLTIGFYDERVTDPPTVISLRVAMQMPNAGLRALRPYVGIARFNGKGITTPQAGLSIFSGGRDRRLLLEVEGWWYSVPEQLLEEEYFDGQLVRRSRTEHGVQTFTVIFRLGLAWPVAR